MDDFQLIGLTGGSGSGKTIVADVFESRGIPSIDADKLARIIVEPGQPCLEELIRCFGGDIVDENGILRRKTLAATAFSDPVKLKRLNEITHFYVRKLKNERVEQLKNEGFKRALFDAPVLIEGNFHKECELVVCVLADRDMRIKRIMARDNLTYEEASRRIDAQQSDEFYIKHSNYVIRNDGDVDQVKARTNEVIDMICKGGNAF